MAPRMTEYDADQVVIYFNGVMVDGFADGEFFTVTQLSDGFTEVVGSSAEVARSKSNDRRATVMVKLLQTSLANQKFSDLHSQDLNAPNGAGVGTFLMQDLQGGTIVQGGAAWIVKYPDGSMDRTAKSREWEIRIANADRTEAGNATVG
jgi:hypothetical protein